MCCVAVCYLILCMCVYVYVVYVVSCVCKLFVICELWIIYIYCDV